jgi:hypothetical protein
MIALAPAALSPAGCQKPVPVITITGQPKVPAAPPVEGSVSATLTVTANATGNAAPSYQWYCTAASDNSGGTPIEGATSATYPLPADLAVGTYRYFVEVAAAGAATVRSETATVTVAVSAILQTMSMYGMQKSIGLAGNGEATIDWGDGSEPQTVTLPELPTPASSANPSHLIIVEHTYPPHNELREATIAVTGAHITGFHITGVDKIEPRTRLYGMTELKYLYIVSDGARTPDFREFPALEYLRYTSDVITSLDVSDCLALGVLNCPDNLALASIDMSECPGIEFPGCYRNALTSIDVSGMERLRTVWCDGNRMGADAPDALFTALPVWPASTRAEVIYGDNPGAAAADKSIGEAKGRNMRDTQ